jgi:hypothetical protein
MTELEAINRLSELVPDWFRKETLPFTGTFYQVRLVTRANKHVWHTLGDTVDLFNAEHLLVNLTAFVDSRGWTSNIICHPKRELDAVEVTLESQDESTRVFASNRTLALATACVHLLKQSRMRDEHAV